MARLASTLVLIPLLTVIVFGVRDLAVPKGMQRREPASPAKVIELPPPLRKWRPTVSVQHALRIASTDLRNRGVNTTRHYVSEARLITYGGESGKGEPRWLIVWVHEEGTELPIQVTVSMAGVAAAQISM